MGTSISFLSLIIVSFLLIMLMPSISSSQYLGNNVLLTHRKILPITQQGLTSYAVIFDAGSTGTRVHVFHFDQNLDLIHIGSGLEFYDKITPGLSAYAKNPKQAAESLVPLLEEAENVVPEDLQPKTPVRLGATAGLRLLNGNASERILEEVKNLLEYRTALNLKPNAVGIIDGTQEGSYLWVVANYVKGKLGKKFTKTVGVIDLGGGSVQMAYAVSKDAAKKAPKVAAGEDPYIKKLFLKRKPYNLYVHSYLRYGKEASRAEILKITNGAANPCIFSGFEGTYEYEGVEYKAFAPPAGPNYDECREIILRALNVNAPCAQNNCTFNGIWDGGRGSGQNNLILTSSFYYLAAEIFGDKNKPNAIIRPLDYKTAAKQACEVKFEDAKSTYPNQPKEQLPYTLMDLIYQYTLLVDGFGLDPLQEVTVAKKIEYKGALVDASWPLGSAIEDISSLPKFEKLLYFV